MTSIWFALHIAGVAGLSLYGLLGFFTLWLFVRYRRTSPSLTYQHIEDWPTVAVQLPLFNEREVVERIITSAVNLNYPRHRLIIQVLDDSTDDTTERAADCVARYQAEGHPISLRHREHRRGFKAGALQDALEATDTEYVAIFDADFVPEPNFLLRTVPHLVSDRSLGAVQARWGHINDSFSPLTGAQAVALDKHFAIEQYVRFQADYFPKFNGSAGVWRRECIVAAGGWHEDTLCEDLCLSTRAVLGGWKFHFASDVVAPAELPATMLAYKSQQARWATGATQCLLKYGQPIWRSQNHSTIARLYSLLSMAAYSTHLLLLAILLVQLPLALSGSRLPSWMLLLGGLGLGQPILFVLAQQVLYRDWFKRLRHLPALLLIAIGIAPSNSWAVIRALSASEFTFNRTPKGLRQSYLSSPDQSWFLEIGILIYLLITLYVAIQRANSGPLVLIFSSLLGIGYVTIRSLLENLAYKRRDRPQ
jgi:cellulose synthase/poly-beta-1,6-N-acetylglucosamine synthase-like glycosyltransferase